MCIRDRCGRSGRDTGRTNDKNTFLAGIRQYREDVLVNISVSYSCVDDAFVSVAKHRSYHIGLNVGIAVHDTYFRKRVQMSDIKNGLGSMFRCV